MVVVVGASVVVVVVVVVVVELVVVVDNETGASVSGAPVTVSTRAAGWAKATYGVSSLVASSTITAPIMTTRAINKAPRVVLARPPVRSMETF